jgi:hypothetical protein
MGKAARRQLDKMPLQRQPLLDSTLPPAQHALRNPPLAFMLALTAFND